MNNDFENISEEELKRVTNALDALSNNNNQPTTKEWNNIMEETNKEVKRHASRTRMFGIAASIALLLAVGGSALAITSSKDSKNLNTINKKPKKNNPEVTSTTKPATSEEAALKDTVIINKLTDDSLEMVDGVTRTKISEFTNANVYNPTAEYMGDNNIRLLTSASPSCDEFGTDYFNFKTLKAHQGKGAVGSGIYYSPSGNFYAEIIKDCSFDDPNEQFTSTMTIVNTKTGAKRVLKPETVPGFQAPEGKTGKVSAVAIKWFDDNQILLGTSINYANGLDWALESLDGPISLNDSMNKESEAIWTSDGQGFTQDVIEMNNKLYLLETTDQEGVNAITVKELISGEVVWTKNLSLGEYETVSGRSQLVFGKDIYTVYGSIDEGDHMNGFVYDQKNDKSFFPKNSSYVFPIR